MIYLPLRAGSLGESLQKFMTLAGGDAKAAVNNLKYVVHKAGSSTLSRLLGSAQRNSGLLQKLGLSEEEAQGWSKDLVRWK